MDLNRGDQTKKPRRIDRRELAKLLGVGVAGAAALAGQPSAAPAGEPDTTGSARTNLRVLEEALSGADIQWVDTVLGAAPPQPRTGALATMAGPALQATVVIAQGCVAPGDGGGGLFYWDANDGTDDGGTVIVPDGGIGSVGPCWRRIYSGALFVAWFGARGDGLGDDTIALQNAIMACSTAGGGIVRLPPGRYKTTNTLYVRASNVVLRGYGNASVIAPVGNFDTVVFRSASPATWIYANRLVDLLFDEGGKTGGRMVYGVFVANFIADRIYGSSGWNGMEFETFNNVTLNHPRLESYRGGSGAAYLRLTGGAGGDDSKRSDVARIQEGVFGGVLSAGMKGFDIDGFVATVNLLSVHFVNIGAEALHTRNSVGASTPPEFITANDMECDYPQLECIRLDAGIGFTFVGSQLNGSRSRANIYVGSACRSADFSGGFSSGAQQAGIAIAGKDVTVTSMRFKFNSSDQFPGGILHAYPGIIVGFTSNGVTVTGCRSGEEATSMYQSYGCQVDTGADNFCIVGNVFRHNFRSGVNNGAGTGPSRVVGPNAI